MTTGDEEAKDAPRRSAGAAASRARRIGGAGSPGSAGSAGGSTGQRPAPPAAEPAVPVGLTKAARPAELPPPPPSVGPAQVTVVEIPAWLRWAPAGALTAGAIVMAVLLVTFSHGVWWAKPSGSVEREKVLAAAKTCVATSNTYKYTDLTSFETKALACATGTFRTQLKSTIERLIKVNAPQIKAAQTAKISRGGVEAITSNGKQWTVLLFGELAVTNSNYPKGRTDPFAAQVQMEKSGGKWLMSDLKTVSTPLS